MLSIQNEGAQVEPLTAAFNPFTNSDMRAKPLLKTLKTCLQSMVSAASPRKSPIPDSMNAREFADAVGIAVVAYSDEQDTQLSLNNKIDDAPPRLAMRLFDPPTPVDVQRSLPFEIRQNQPLRTISSPTSSVKSVESVEPSPRSLCGSLGRRPSVPDVVNIEKKGRFTITTHHSSHYQPARKRANSISRFEHWEDAQSKSLEEFHSLQQSELLTAESSNHHRSVSMPYQPLIENAPIAGFERMTLLSPEPGPPSAPTPLKTPKNPLRRPSTAQESQLFQSKLRPRSDSGVVLMATE